MDNCYRLSTPPHRSGGVPVEDPLGRADVVVRRAPLANVQPLGSPTRPHDVIAMQQHQLLLRASGQRLQLGLDRPERRALVGQRHHQDAVGLAHAALRPRRRRRVALVENHAVNVLLLAEPRRQAVLVHAGRIISLEQATK